MNCLFFFWLFKEDLGFGAADPPCKDDVEIGCGVWFGVGVGLIMGEDN